MELVNWLDSNQLKYFVFVLLIAELLIQVFTRS
jgi:hypothetical protein